MRKYETEESRSLLAREIAREAIVLLKNEDHVLPLQPGKTIALIGQTQFDTIIGGGGSGASFSAGTLQIDQELEKAGFVLEKSLKDFYSEAARAAAEAAAAKAEGMKDFFAQLQGLVASGAIYEIFGKYEGPGDEPMPSDEVWTAASERTDTALLIIGRKSGGEECDRHIKDDYYLTGSERALAAKTAAAFEKVIVIFDVNGAVDTAWMNQYPQVKAAFFMGTAGEQAAGALADLVSGKVSPSGKLSQTLALSYEDYPSAEHFSPDKDDAEGLKTYESYGLSAEDNGSFGFDRSPVTVYQEDIYVGYRYFDTFRKPVMFPFGHGLSYAEFEIGELKAEISEGLLKVSLPVTNISKTVSGKEVLQLYIAAPSVVIEQPAKQLKAFCKTGELAPGETEEVEMHFPLNELASYSEKDLAFELEPGIYQILIGESSAEAVKKAEIELKEKVVLCYTHAHIGIAPANLGKIRFLSQQNRKMPGQYISGESVRIPLPSEMKQVEAAVLGQAAAPDQAAGQPGRLQLKADDFIVNFPVYPQYDFSLPAKTSTLSDVAAGKVKMEEFLNQMSPEELAVLCCGYGPGLPFGGLGSQAPSTLQYEDGSDIGYNSHKSANPGYENPALAKYGIQSAFYKDGPASCGKTAWPTGMMIAGTFNQKLMYEFGNACGYEAEIQDVDSWLAPGMNIIRNPIEGRAFEYFSEDPIVAGLAGTLVSMGAMENNRITTCPKHFALNEQETYRRGKTSRNYDAVDTIATERAIREIYLKPFEMVITQAKPTTIMTSFNKVNGNFAAGNKALCTDILREEWAYTGVVVTDWGDMDTVVDGADAVAAGNDVVMPGGPPVIAQILKGYEEGRVTLDQMKTAVGHLMNFVMNSRSQTGE